MEVVEVKQYIGKRVLVVLQNNFKFTFTMPDFNGHVFSIVDKFGNNVTIECSLISLIYEKRGENDI